MRWTMQCVWRYALRYALLAFQEWRPYELGVRWCYPAHHSPFTRVNYSGPCAFWGGCVVSSIHSLLTYPYL